MNPKKLQQGCHSHFTAWVTHIPLWCEVGWKLKRDKRVENSFKENVLVLWRSMDGNEWWESLSVGKTTELMKMLLKFNIYPLKLSIGLTFDAPDLQYDNNIDIWCLKRMTKRTAVTKLYNNYHEIYLLFKSFEHCNRLNMKIKRWNYFLVSFEDLFDYCQEIEFEFFH